MSKPPREDKAVKIDRALANKADYVANQLGLTLAEYLTELLRKPVERDFAKQTRGVTGGEDDPGPEDKADRVAEIARLAGEGLTQAEIARRLGVTQSTVSRLLKRAKGESE